MPHRLPKNAPVQALPVKMQAFSFMLTRAFVWLISIVFTLFVGATSIWLLLTLWVQALWRCGDKGIYGVLGVFGDESDGIFYHTGGV